MIIRLLTLYFISQLWGCSTTNSNASRIDNVRGELIVYSSGDERSTFANKEYLENAKESEGDIKSERQSDVESLLSIAGLQIVQNKLKEAEATIKKALRIDLKNEKAKKYLAQVYIRQNKHELAGVILNNLGGEGSKDSEVLNMLALISLKNDSPSDAMRLFKQAIKARSSNIAARLNLGVMHLKHRQINAAATQFERVLKIMPQNREAKLHLAVILTAKNKHKEAIAILDEVLDNDRQNPLALYNLAVAHQNIGEFDVALENLKAYVKSKRTRASNSNQVFALIDEIQREKIEAKTKVTDADIQDMAATIGSTESDEIDELEISSNSADKRSEEDPELLELEKQLAH